MAISSADKGGRELAAAWLRRAGDQRIAGVDRKRATLGEARRPAPKPESVAVFHSDTHVGFSRA